MHPVTPTLSVDCDRQLVASEVTSQRTAEWIIETPTQPRQATRAPLNLGLIIDRSGSMQGDKLRYVQQAACHVLDLLDERDRIAIVAYDDQITVLSRSEPLTAQMRNNLKARVMDLQPGG